MGIPGLLVALKSYLSSSAPPPPIATSTSIRHSNHHHHHQSHSTNKKHHDPPPPTYNGNIYTDFHNQAVAIDASSWFHKSVYSIADHYVECIEKLNLTSAGNSNNTSIKLDAKCILASRKYMIERCTELLSTPHRNGASKIYLVMDGERCPLKSVTNQERTDKRTKALEMARKYKAQGQLDKMHEQYRSCIKVVNALSYTVALQVEQHFASLSDPRVEIVWSPYEADAQLVQLCGIERRCSAVITEDSDVLVYCAACNVSIPIIYKLDRKTGYCSTLSMDWLIHPMKFQSERFTTNNNNNTSTHNTALVHMQQSTKVSTIDTIFDILVGRQIQHPGWGTRIFVQGCVLAGCDYSPRGQIPGVGFVNAFKYVQMAGLSPNHQPLDTVFDRILKSFLPMKCRRLILDAIPILEIQLSQSEAVFYYHPVLKTNSHTVVEYLNEMSTVDSDLKYQPSLRRYDSDLSFLGALTMNRTMGDSGIIPKNMLHESNNNRKRKSTDSGHKNDRRPTKSILVPFSKSTNHNHVLSDDVSPLSSSTASFVRPNIDVDQNENKRPQLLKQPQLPARPVVNPYNQPHKKVPRPPLQSLNPFDVYARRHRELGILDSNRIVTAKLPFRSKKNVSAASVRDNHSNHELFSCPLPPPKKRTTAIATTSFHHKNTVNDVRFVKRTDYGINIDMDKQTYRPTGTFTIRRNESEPNHPVPTSVNLTRLENDITQHKTIHVAHSSSELKNTNVTISRSTRSPRVIVKSKFFSEPIGETTSSKRLFEIKEECPSLLQSKLDVVSLIDFDQYESQSLLSPDKSPTVFRNEFDYEITNESPRNDKLLFEPPIVPAVHGRTTDSNFCFQNDNNVRPNSSHAHRRVTLELSNEENVELIRPNIQSSNGKAPIQFNFYDSVPCQSPSNDIIDVDEDIDEGNDTSGWQKGTGIFQQTAKTLKYTFGSAMSEKPSGKKVVKRSNVIQRVLKKHRTSKRDPTQTTLPSHFYSERRSLS